MYLFLASLITHRLTSIYFIYLLIFHISPPFSYKLISTLIYILTYLWLSWDIRSTFVFANLLPYLCMRLCLHFCVYVCVCICVHLWFVSVCLCIYLYHILSFTVFIFLFWYLSLYISLLCHTFWYCTLQYPSVIWKLGDCVLWTPFNYALYLKSCWLYTLDTIIYNDVGKKHMSFHVDFSECFCAVKWYLENMIMFIISLFILFLFFCFFYLFFCGNMTLDSDAICWR